MSDYQSKYCTKDTKVSGAQYLAELMCEKSARQKGIELSDHFWRSKKWNGVYRRHITQLYRLLATYSIEAVLRAFKDPRTKNYLSFGNKAFLPIIQEHETALRAVDAREPEELNVATKVEPPRQPHGKRSTLSILRELDGQKTD